MSGAMAKERLSLGNEGPGLGVVLDGQKINSVHKHREEMTSWVKDSEVWILSSVQGQGQGITMVTLGQSLNLFEPQLSRRCGG